MLLLPAEIAAARHGDAALALTMHQEAKAVAEQLGAHYTHRVTAFGAANVALHRLAALVRLHEGDRAVRYASTIDATAVASLPTERKANYLLDLAQAWHLTRQYGKAVQALHSAEQMAKEEVRCRPATHVLIRGLLGRAKGEPARTLRGMAVRAGLET